MIDFEHPNMRDFECPVCHTSADFPVVLIPKYKGKFGDTVEAEQIHTECYKVVCKMNGIDPNIEEPLST